MYMDMKKVQKLDELNIHKFHISCLELIEVFQITIPITSCLHSFSIITTPIPIFVVEIYSFFVLLVIAKLCVGYFHQYSYNYRGKVTSLPSTLIMWLCTICYISF